MLETMYVRCTHCGYDNSPEYRFCGMCGASLAHPPVEAKAPPRQAQASGNGGGEKGNVHGPSFLGLAEDPKTEFHYLYEDEPARSHVGLIVFLLIIFGAAGFLGWQWKQGGFPFNRAAGSAANSSGAQTSASPSEVAPAMSQNQEANSGKPMNAGGDVQPTPPDQSAQNAAASKPPEPTEKDLPATANSQPAAPENTATEKNPGSEEDTTREAKAAPAPTPAKPHGTANESSRARLPKAVAPAPKPATPAAPDADLALAGERYLYGTGVPQNCTRAESSLRTAAMHGNTKAQTVLGTMYATGHCVGRDLPTAYRWFARALRQEPQNSRIAADLQVLWRQMTPQEKQLATASSR